MVISTSGIEVELIIYLKQESNGLISNEFQTWLISYFISTGLDAYCMVKSQLGWGEEKVAIENPRRI